MLSHSSHFDGFISILQPRRSLSSLCHRFCRRFLFSLPFTSEFSIIFEQKYLDGFWKPLSHILARRSRCKATSLCCYESNIAVLFFKSLITLKRIPVSSSVTHHPVAPYVSHVTCKYDKTVSI